MQQDAGSFPEALVSQKAAASLLLEGGETDVQLLEKIIIAVASLGDIPTTSKLLKELWRLTPHYQFHNSLPFVKVVDRYDELVSGASQQADSQTVLQQLELAYSNITTITDKAFFDIKIGSHPPQRVVVGLYRYAAPRGVHNFLSMAECSYGPQFCYKNSKFHRIIKDFIVQGGDVAPGDGTGTTNIYQRPYGDEPFAQVLMHNAPGIVQLANAGPDSNGGQFVFTMLPTPHLNGNHVIIGKVLVGFDYLQRVNSIATDDASRPKEDVLIVDCGKLAG